MSGKLPNLCLLFCVQADPDAVDVNEEPADQPAKAVNTSLYGEWQTEVWVAPEAKDGVVPKNERGNVMCPPLVPSLPKVCWPALHLSCMLFSAVQHHE